MWHSSEEIVHIFELAPFRLRDEKPSPYAGKGAEHAKEDVCSPISVYDQWWSDQPDDEIVPIQLSKLKSAPR